MGTLSRNLSPKNHPYAPGTLVRRCPFSQFRWQFFQAARVGEEFRRYQLRRAFN